MDLAKVTSSMEDVAMSQKKKEMNDFFSKVESGKLGWKQSSGTTIHYAMSGGDMAYKGLLKGAGRLLTFNTVQRISNIYIYNVDKNTMDALDEAYTNYKDNINMRLINDVLNARNKTLEKTERDYGSGMVDYKIWLD